MKPSLGRIVIYTHPHTGEDLAAIVTRVEYSSVGVIHLTAFPSNGTPRIASNVLYDEAGKLGCWRWPERV